VDVTGSIWILPAAIVAVGSAALAFLAARVAARADMLRKSLIELPTAHQPLHVVDDELHRVRLTVEDLHHR
jgi:hypothetical protein